MPFWEAEEQTRHFALAHVNCQTGCAGPVQWHHRAPGWWGSFGGVRLPLLPQPEEEEKYRNLETALCIVGGCIYFFFSVF